MILFRWSVRRPCRHRAAGRGGDGTLPGAIRAITVPTSTVSPTGTRISATTPDAGDGTSVSILSVEISQIVASASIRSPGSTRQATTVPSATDTPIWGIVTSTRVSVGEELTASLLHAIDAGQHRLLERWRERIGTSGVATLTTGPSSDSNPRSAISAATCAPAAQVALASSMITTFEQRSTESRIASSSSGTSDRRSSTSTDAPSRSSVASRAPTPSRRTRSRRGRTQAGRRGR